MKKLWILIAGVTLSSAVFSQNDGMMNNTSNSSFSVTQILLWAILLVLIIGGLVWIINNNRRVK